MQRNKPVKKWIAMMLCLCALMQCVSVMASAATEDNLCEHHPEHTDDCGYEQMQDAPVCSFHCEICSAASAEENTEEIDSDEETGEAIIGDTCGENLTWTLDDKGELFISGTGEMYNWTNNSSVPWAEYREKIKTVVVEDGVSTIGGCAFASCTNLTGVSLPGSLVSIGHKAFMSCGNLMSVDLSEGLRTIDSGAFYDCGSLTGIDLPDSLTSIGDSAFYGCGLTGIDIPDNTASIGACAFYGCGSLTKVNLPDSLTSINDYVFTSCGFARIDLPENLDSIGMCAFSNCGNLTSINFPDGLSAICNYAFSNCTSLTEMTFTGNWPSIYGASFANVTATAYYPKGNITWASSKKRQNFGGTITWVRSDYDKFEDVVPGTYYEEPVQWAVKKGIANGVDDSHFAPGAACTRAQVVTFLWRAAGSPEPASASNPFADVSEGSYYYKAVLWAAEKGITAGTSATAFFPNAPCTRGQVVTFLWRFQGKPASGGSNVFGDVAPGAYCYDAVLWAVEKGITQGMGDGTFGTASPCSRAQIVTFLYRTLG